MINLMIVLILCATPLFLLGFYINWLLVQPEENIFIMDEKQKIEHDKNREGIPQ